MQAEKELEFGVDTVTRQLYDRTRECSRSPELTVQWKLNSRSMVRVHELAGPKYT